jgi:hypothetical protein
MYDLRTSTVKKEGSTIENTNKGKKILANAWEKQGYNKLNNHKVYSYHGLDVWKGILGKMSQIWPDLESEMEFKFQIGTFNGQVTFIEGSEAGMVAGLQNWNYYEIIKGDTLIKNKDAKENKRHVFGIAAFQYFTEMLDRLKSAPIISYAGEDEMRGQKYDLVFCTWKTANPHEEHDQYMVWINQKTGLMDFTQYTIRESFLKPPGYKMIGGAIEFNDFKNINGVMIPHEQFVYAIKLRKNRKKNLHHLVISDFQFDNFNLNELQINPSIQLGGNFKNY